MTKPSAAATSLHFLIVDDETQLREAVARFLRKCGYEVTTAGSGPEALQRLEMDNISLMLLDVHMPGMSGIDVVEEALRVDPDVAIVMLSAAADATTAAGCMQRGALDYLTKPIELSNLEGAVKRALRKRATLLQEQEISGWLKHEVTERARQLARAKSKQQELTVATLEALINALEAKNPHLAGHSARVAALAATIASELDLSDDEIEQVRTAGRLHDLGKIGIRENVMNKKGRLTDEEYQHIKQHVCIGTQILAPLKYLGPVVSTIRSHHEHWDGNGYPDGLSGHEIPLGGRILCATEVYDALTTARPYQKKVTPEEAVARMRLLNGKVLDPEVMDALSIAVQRNRALVFLDEDPDPDPPNLVCVGAAPLDPTATFTTGEI